jgi:predicted  nucleic acid-binding Zn-ribbon protein
MLPSDGEVSLRIVWEDGTTNIDATDIEDVSVIVDGIYDLNGRKVADDIEMLNTLPEGVYIINGKKILNTRR